MVKILKTIFYIEFLIACASALHLDAMEPEKDLSIISSSIREKISFTEHKNYEGIRSINAFIDQKCIAQTVFQDNEIIQLHVLKNFRLQSIGSTLFIKVLNLIKKQGHSYAWWYAAQSIPYYLRFGAKLDAIPTQAQNEKPSAHMYFEFDRDGNPLENLKKFKKDFITL